MSSKLLKQEEIDALLSQPVETQVPEEIENQEEITVGQDDPKASLDVNNDPDGTGEETPVFLPGGDAEDYKYLLKDEEKDALGEIGNISMGSAATTLSVLLNHKVTITSPRVTVTTVEKLFKSFSVPHMSIFVRYTAGLSGYNFLIMKLSDASVLADLMMGGDGIGTVEELTDIGISAASEAMNQMIGTASTSMSAIFERTINISPPETKIYENAGDLKPPLDYKGPIVVVWFKMTVEDIVDTEIMQVMGIDTAEEEAELLLGKVRQDSRPDYSEEPDRSEEMEEQAGPAVLDIEEVVETAAEPEPDESFEFPVPQRAAPVETAGVAAGPAADQNGFTVSGIRESAPASTEAVPFDQRRLNRILDIPLKITVVLGRTRWPIKDILGITPGSIVELQNYVDEPVEVLVNGTPVAVGEVVVVNENFGVRITSIIEPEERLRNLGR